MVSCVLCVVEDVKGDFDNQLFEAQKIALTHSLPLAVIHVVDKPSEEVPAILEGLRAIEQRLLKLNTPLMILVGDPEERIKSVAYHLKPYRILTTSSKINGDVIKHPIAWPGTIISIEQLLESGFLCDD